MFCNKLSTFYQCSAQRSKGKGICVFIQTRQDKFDNYCKGKEKDIKLKKEKKSDIFDLKNQKGRGEGIIKLIKIKY